MTKRYTKELNISKSREKYLCKEIENIFDRIEGEGKAEIIKEISNREDLSNLERVFLAYKVGFIYAKLGGE